MGLMLGLVLVLMLMLVLALLMERGLFLSDLTSSYGFVRVVVLVVVVTGVEFRDWTLTIVSEGVSRVQKSRLRVRKL